MPLDVPSTMSESASMMEYVENDDPFAGNGRKGDVTLAVWLIRAPRGPYSYATYIRPQLRLATSHSLSVSRCMS